MPKINNISSKEINEMKGVINEIRGSHFALGETKNDFKTTTGSTYVYDNKLASGAKGSLDGELINDLRATHYKLGYMPNANFTTHQSSFVPHAIKANKFKDNHLRKTNIDLNPGNRNVFDGKTIYMLDFKKQ